MSVLLYKFLHTVDRLTYSILLDASSTKSRMVVMVNDTCLHVHVYKGTYFYCFFIYKSENFFTLKVLILPIYTVYCVNTLYTLYTQYTQYTLYTLYTLNTHDVHAAYAYCIC